MKSSLGRKSISLITLAFLTLMSAVILFPIWMTLINSLKSRGEMLNNMLALPVVLRFENYIYAFQKTNYLNSLLNTVIITLAGLAGIVLLASMAGYKLSRTKTRLSNVIFSLFVMSMLIPFYSIMITLYRIIINLSLDDSLLGLGLIYTGLGVPMAIFLFHGFVKSIPLELDEAAVIDGCDDYRLFFRIIFPLLHPITATIIILNGLWMWNDFLLPLLVLSDSRKHTILIAITALFGQYGNNEWTAILATLTAGMLPAIIFYLLLQKNIVKGIADGAIKG